MEHQNETNDEFDYGHEGPKVSPIEAICVNCENFGGCKDCPYLKTME